jgi:hypothetical protein
MGRRLQTGEFLQNLTGAGANVRENQAPQRSYSNRAFGDSRGPTGR